MLPAHVKIVPLTPSMVGKSVDCIGASFTRREDPFTKCLNLNQNQWVIMSQMFVHRASRKDLSFIAYNEKEDRVDGVMINEDWKEAPPADYRELYEWRPVRAIFNELHTRYKAAKPRIEHGKVLHPLYFTCVRPECRKQGIMTSLWQSSVKLAQEYNYEVMLGEASTKHTKRVLAEKLGFRPTVEVPYKDFKFEGNHVYRSIDKDEFDGLVMLERSVTSDLFI